MRAAERWRQDARRALGESLPSAGPASPKGPRLRQAHGYSQRQVLLSQMFNHNEEIWQTQQQNHQQ